MSLTTTSSPFASRRPAAALLLGIVAFAGSGCGQGDGNGGDVVPAAATAPDSTSAAEPAAPVAPPPLTEDDVAAMTKQEMLESLARVSAARRVALEQGDTELRDRLKKDFDLLMARIKEAPGRPPAATGAEGPPPIPDPMTAEQIEAMTRAEALEALAAVTQARRWADSQGDDELAARLKSEFDLLMERVKRQ
ncbi:MAG: hypothetical protein ACYTJ0_10790 [Planctomycetota bacterium]|jgi:hypothetical protein